MKRMTQKIIKLIKTLSSEIMNADNNLK